MKLKKSYFLNLPTLGKMLSYVQPRSAKLFRFYTKQYWVINKGPPSRSPKVFFTVRFFNGTQRTFFPSTREVAVLRFSGGIGFIF